MTRHLLADQSISAGLVNAVEGGEHAFAFPLDGTRPERECDCPEWVIRCVHFNGRTMVLTGSAGAAVHTCRLTKDCFTPFGLYEVIGWRPCNVSTDCTGALAIPSPTTRLKAFWHEADALAAFYAAELELLRGAE